MITNKKLPTEQVAIIIGAGAAGLLAARRLSDAGMSVIVIEAAATAGGRMLTLTEEGFSIPIEAGAEFIHGELPITIGLLQEAGIEFGAIAGEMKTVRSGQWLETDPMNGFWDEMMQRMEEVKIDITIDAFINQYFSDPKYKSLVDGITRFAEGFDLADPKRASVLALKKEWANGFEEEQYRIVGGYKLLAAYLVDCCKKNNVQFHFSSPVTRILWSNDKVTVHTADRAFEGNKALVTVSAGIMQSGKIVFSPEPVDIVNAFKDIGYGSVIKFLLEFEEPFWNDKLKDAGFVLSDERVPTWWTQAPGDSKLLTGWLGGPSAEQASSLSEAELLKQALQSLCTIFHLPIDKLSGLLVNSRIINWTNHPVSLGGYSYSLPSSEAAKKLLNTSVEETLFFAGEAIYLGDNPGTVEAAFVTAEEAAVRMLGS